MSPRTTRTVWTAGLASIVLVPGTMLPAGMSGSSVLGTLSVVLGLLGLCLLVTVVVVPSRMRSLTAAFGVERVMGLHRWLGILAVVLVGMHAAAAVAGHPALINPFAAGPATQVGYGATAALLLVGGAAARGRRPGARYEVWARLHVLLAAVALVLAGLHVFWLGDLLEDPVMRVCLSALCLVLIGVLAHRWVWRPLFSRQGAYVVYGVRRESPTVSTLVLAPVHVRRGGLRFSPGQFAWLRLRRGVVGTEEHPFTIASSAQVTGRLELTVRDVGDFSGTLGRLTVGRKVWLDGPHGAFTVDRSPSNGVVLLAGGVGITPMMSMLRTLADRGDRRTHRLVVAERGDEPLFADELAVLGRRLDLVVTRTGGHRHHRIDAALLAEVLPPPPARDRLEYFICGSPSVLAGALAALEQVGVPASRVHTEQFGWSGAVPIPGVPADRTAPGPAAPSPGDAGGARLAGGSRARHGRASLR